MFLLFNSTSYVETDIVNSKSFPTRRAFMHMLKFQQVGSRCFVADMYCMSRRDNFYYCKEYLEIDRNGSGSLSPVNDFLHVPIKYDRL